MKMPKIGKFGRSAACILLVLAVFAVYELRLFQWQVLRGDEFEQISLSNRTDTIEIEAARGEILDRDGNVLAGNRSSYNIVYDALDMDYSARNATILQVLDLLMERGEDVAGQAAHCPGGGRHLSVRRGQRKRHRRLAGVFGAGRVRHCRGLHERPDPPVRLPGLLPGGRPERGVRALLHDPGRLFPHQPLRHRRGRLRRDRGRHQRARQRVARHRDPGGCHPHLRGGRLFGPPRGGLHRRHHRHTVPAGRGGRQHLRRRGQHLRLQVERHHGPLRPGGRL